MPQYLFHLYDEPLNLAGKNLVSLSGSSREEFNRLIPCIVAPSEMESRVADAELLTAYNGELADEVREFSRAIHIGCKLKKVLLKQGNVVEVCLGS